MLSASIRDPDNMDTVFSEGDEVTVVFSVDTGEYDSSTSTLDLRPVASKWEIDKLLTFCTPCNPECQRGPANAGFANALPATRRYDDEYNGIGSAYSGEWRDAHTLVITVINATLPVSYTHLTLPTKA